MELVINIIDRNYEQIKEFCEFNNITIEDYVVQCAEDDFFTRKYGDLNEKLKPSETKTEEKTINKPTDVIKTEKKKTTRAKKVKEEKETENDDGKLKIDDILINNTNQVLIKKEEIIDTTNENKPKVVKRTLRTR